jgi:sugar phosphate isomerase/epimerase
MGRAMATLCVGAALTLRAAGLADQVAIQTWTLRNLNFDQVVEFAQRHGIKDLQLIPNHLDYKKESKEQWATKKARLEAAGLRAYTYGVAGTSMNKEENRALFEFARFMGMKLVVVEPGDFRIWDNLEELAKEYDIRVAVHNHGIKSLYGNPAIVRQVIGHRDARLGVCLDVGWITSGNFDAAQVFTDYKGRVFDIHLKDKKVQKTAKGDDVANDTHVGQGDANYAGLFKVLRAQGYTGRLAIETDSQEFARQPDEFVRKAKEFVSGADAAR